MVEVYQKGTGDPSGEGQQKLRVLVMCGPRVDIMAKVVEASRLLGGDEARLKAHDWCIRAGGNMSSMTIAAQVAAATGLETSALRAMMDSAEVQKRLDLDDTDKKRTWKATYPSIVIDNRHVMRWSGTGIDSKALLLKIIEDAKASKSK